MANDPIRKAQILPSRLALIRDKMGWKQGDFAENLMEITGTHISLQAISLWETNRRPVPEKYYDAICQMCSCTLSYLCGFTDDPESEVVELYEGEQLERIEIAESDLYKYHKKPIFVEFIDKKHIDEWGLYDSIAGHIIFTDCILKLNNARSKYLRFYSQKPSHIISGSIENKKTLDFNSMMALDRVYIEVNSSDGYIRGLYNGWYKHDATKSCLIKADNNLILSYNGLGVAYKAFSTNIIIS